MANHDTSREDPHGGLPETHTGDPTYAPDVTTSHNPHLETLVSNAPDGVFRRRLRRGPPLDSDAS